MIYKFLYLFSEGMKLVLAVMLEPMIFSSTE
jgi:hypothetical protein